MLVFLRQMSLKTQSQEYYTLDIKTRLKDSSTEIFTYFIKLLSTPVRKRKLKKGY